MVFLHLCSPFKSPQILLHLSSSSPRAPHSSCFLCSASARSHSLAPQSYCVIFSCVIALQSQTMMHYKTKTLPLIFFSSVMFYLKADRRKVWGRGSVVVLCNSAVELGKVNHSRNGNASNARGKVLCYYALQRVCVLPPQAEADHHSTTEAQISRCFCHTANVSSEAEPGGYFYCALRGHSLC